MLKYQISWKSVQWEPSCSIRWDGQTSMSLAAIINTGVRFVPLVTKTSYSSMSLATMTNRTIRLRPLQQWQATQTNTSRNLAKDPLRRQRTANPSHCTSLTQVTYIVNAITCWPNSTDFWFGYIHYSLRTVKCVTHRQGTPRHTSGPSRSPNRP
jgi:hypothetical protein